MKTSLSSRKSLDFSSRPLVMGIINCTSDSFYSLSQANTLELALEKARAMIQEGADILDLGGESSRPGAEYVSADEEISRVLPVLKAIRNESDIPISIDTRKFVVAKTCAEYGIDIVNDISALEDAPEIASLAREEALYLVLMHKKGIPLTMQEEPYYTDVIQEVRTYLHERASFALKHGVKPEQLILDPGIGFGKRLEDNIDLIAHLEDICSIGYPVLMGLSRKRFIGAITGRETEDRLAGTISAHLFSLLHGASILRAHDVKEAVDTVKMYTAFKNRMAIIK